MTGADDPNDAARRRRDISLKLTVIARRMRKQFDQKLERLDVTRSLWTVIAVVSRHPGATQRGIAEVLEMSETAAGRLIDRLVADGLLARHPRADDRRAYRIELTDAARPMLDQVEKIASWREEQTFAGIADDDLRKLEALLDVVYRNINA